MDNLLTVNASLPGLAHYDESRRDIYTGRARQVEDLLSILQESRFICLVGPEASGKTSLVRAGLVPRLREGFKGVAGNQWRVTFCKPGITPIENLAAALAASEALTEQPKASLELEERITALIHRDHSGILNALSLGAFPEQTNFLVVIDQFEDIFQLADKFDKDVKWDQVVGLFMSNIARAVGTPNASVYVMVIMQAEFIHSLYNYRFLHRFLNTGLYSMPLIRQDDFARILKCGLEGSGTALTADAVDHLQTEFNQDLRNLPNLQLMMGRVIERYGDASVQPLPEVNAADLGFIGPLETLQPASLEAYYESLPASGKGLMEHLFRHITHPGQAEAMKRPKTILEISRDRGIDKLELTRFIKKFSTERPGAIDIIEPFQKNVHHFVEDHLPDGTVINVATVHLMSRWQRLQKWIEEERRAVALYLRICSAAKLFDQNQTGYLRPPDLDNYLNWWHEFAPKQSWTEQFNRQYHQAYEYLTTSKQQYDAEVERKEAERKAELRKARRRTIFSLFLMGVFGMLAIVAVVARYQARVAMKEARESATVAENERKKAVKSAEEARLEKDKAKESEREAQLAKTDAEKQKEIAQEQTKIAQSEEQKAKRLTGELKTESERAKRNETIAMQKADEAKRSAEEADRQKRNAQNRADYEAVGKEILTLLNRINAEEFDDRQKALAFSRQVTDAYGRFETFSKLVNNGQVLADNNLFQLLTMTKSKVVEHARTISQSEYRLADLPNGLRDIDISGSDRIVAAGDDDILLHSTDGGRTIKRIPLAKKGRVRTIAFSDADNVVYGTSDGEIYLRNLGSGNERRLLASTPQQGQDIVNSLVVRSDKVFAAVGGKLVQVTLSNGSRSDLPIPRVLQVFELDGRNLIARSNDGLYLVQTTDLATTKLNVGVIALTAVAAGQGLVFLGDERGTVRIYRTGATAANLNPVKEIKPHLSRVTALSYDALAGQLFTASLDRTAQILPVSGNLENIQTNPVSLEGFEKWIWGFEPVRTAGQQGYLYSVDEAGMLMRWMTQPADINRHIINWQKSVK